MSQFQRVHTRTSFPRCSTDQRADIESPRWAKFTILNNAYLHFCLVFFCRSKLYLEYLLSFRFLVKQWKANKEYGIKFIYVHILQSDKPGGHIPTLNPMELINNPSQWITCDWHGGKGSLVWSFSVCINIISPALIVRFPCFEIHFGERVFVQNCSIHKSSLLQRIIVSSVLSAVKLQRTVLSSLSAAPSARTQGRLD